MDKGIIFYGMSGGGTAYPTIKGTVGTAQALSTTVWLASDDIYVGAGQSILLTVKGPLASGQTAKIRAVTTRNTVAAITGAVAVAFTNGAIQLTRGDVDNAGDLAENTITAAQLVGPLVNASDGPICVNLMGATAKLSGTFKLLVKCTQAIDAADVLIITADVA